MFRKALAGHFLSGETMKKTYIMKEHQVGEPRSSFGRHARESFPARARTELTVWTIIRLRQKKPQRKIQIKPHVSSADLLH